MLGLHKIFHRERPPEAAHAAAESEGADTVILLDWVPEDELETRPFLGEAPAN